MKTDLKKMGPEIVISLPNKSVDLNFFLKPKQSVIVICLNRLELM